MKAHIRTNMCNEGGNIGRRHTGGLPGGVPRGESSKERADDAHALYLGEEKDHSVEGRTSPSRTFNPLGGVWIPKKTVQTLELERISTPTPTGQGLDRPSMGAGEGIAKFILLKSSVCPKDRKKRKCCSLIKNKTENMEET